VVLQLLLLVISCIPKLTAWLHDSQLITAGQAEEAARAMKEQLDEISRANQARARARDDIAAHGVRAHDDDERTDI
jgi:hypothetical protein